jgi:isopenicillin-N epimerase
MEYSGWSKLADNWGLDRSVVFLNHGSFGACPTAVLEYQQRLRRQMESEPVRFFARDYQQLLDAARTEVAAFLGADADSLAFVTNATTGINAALRALDLGPGDELLLTDHEYPACRNAAREIAVERGFRVVVASVPFPIASEDAVVDAVESRIGPATRAILVDHVTSPTALILPVARIASAARERGIRVVVDGAHAPGMLDLDIGALAVDAYAGNCHKWLCAPKGAGVVWLSPELRQRARPPVLSHGASAPANERFHAEFDWTGTGDPTGWLSVPEAIRVIGGLVPGGWTEVRRRNHELALEARDRLCQALAIDPPAPDGMIGSMTSLPLSDGGRGVGPIDPLQDHLWHEHRIEVPVISWPAAPHRVLRVSAQLYNTVGQYSELANALCHSLERR